ncbi:MAG: four helix bundle protein [Bacteroidales bacterium]|jgi:four helix bundle protein|nr:four helix bundle protein [Bacteroidales bacterium]
MGVEKFEDLKVWRISINLSIRIYNSLKDSKEFGLKDQLQRASVSIPSNIAEGFDRKTNKEYIYFLHIAQGSCAELRTQLYLVKELGIIKDIESDDLIETTRKISAMIHRLIQSRQKF